MALTLYISTKNPSHSALVKSLTNNQPQNAPEFTLGDTLPTVNVYLIDGDGGYDSLAGTGTARLAIGTVGGVPTGGTFTLTDGTYTTAAIAYDASAATVQTAMNAVNSGAGLSGGTVVVTGSSPRWIATWNAVSDRTLLTGSGTSLTPSSGVSVSTLTAGTGSAAEVQLIRLARNPAAFQDTWTAISGQGWYASLSLATRELLDLVGTSSSLSTTLEFEHTDGSGNRRTYLQIPCTVYNELIDLNASVSVASGTSYLATGDALDQYVQNRTALTSLDGETSADLDSLVTVGKTKWAVRFLCTTTLASNAEVKYDLVSGALSQSLPWVVHPIDYNASTNAKTWQLKQVTLDGAPCIWNAASSKFHQMVANEVGGVVTLAIDQTGFALV